VPQISPRGTLLEEFFRGFGWSVLSTSVYTQATLIKRGNPFFVEETVRTLLETKALVGERGAYRLVQSIGAIQIPATVQAILAARIDRLAPETKHLLQVAAVIGKDVPFTLLREIAEEPEERLRSLLVQLQTAEFLHETALFPDPEYSFKHALTHEVTYGSLLQAHRRGLHARIVAAIERLLELPGRWRPRPRARIGDPRAEDRHETGGP
jgi:predicted ATPase